MTLTTISSSISDCKVKFTWSNAFTSGLFGGKSKITLKSWEFEHICLLWNIAAVMSHIATDTTDQQSAKYFQQAAGIYNYIDAGFLRGHILQRCYLFTFFDNEEAHV